MAVMDRLPEILVPGRSEAQAAWEIEKAFRDLGASELAFAPIVAVDANAALPHAIPGDTVITDGCLVLVDVGGRHADYCSDQTRTVWVGSRPPERFTTLLARVKRAQAAALARLGPGLSYREAHGLARDVFEAEGVAGHFTHSLGPRHRPGDPRGPQPQSGRRGRARPGHGGHGGAGAVLPPNGAGRAGSTWPLITADGCETL